MMRNMFLIVCLLSLTAVSLVSAEDFKTYDKDIEMLEQFLTKHTSHTTDADEQLGIDETIRLCLTSFSEPFSIADQTRRERLLLLLERVYHERYGLHAPAFVLSFFSRHATELARALATQGVIDSNPYIAIASAAILLEAGEWEIAAPVLDSLGDFRALTSTTDPRAVSFLKRTIEQSDDPNRRILAAYYLGFVYKEWDFAVAAARREALQNRDQLIPRERVMLLNVLENGSSSEDIPLIATFANDTRSTVFTEALGILARKSQQGILEAQAILENLAANGSNDVKVTSKQILRNLKAAKEAK